MKKVSARGIKFPISKTNRNGETVLITKDVCEGKTVYLLNVNNGAFKYTSSNFEKCLGYSGLPIHDIKC